MRIIAGEFRGKNINPPVGFKARPTTDFAKEGLFNVLVNGHDLSQCRVLDLFSGTGSISFEFASRGCLEVVSVEMNPANASFIKKTMSQLDIKNIQAVRHNVFDFINICKLDFDIIFADPPYEITGLDTIPDKILSREGKPLLREGGILILEHPASYSFKKHPSFIKEKKYGNVHFSFFS